LTIRHCHNSHGNKKRKKFSHFFLCFNL
jgi:hypothetical protein